MEIHCFDLDGTICEEKKKGTPYTEYANVEPFQDVIDYINELYDNGNKIIIFTARHMVSTNGDLDKIIDRVGKITEDWLSKHNVKYHELKFGKIYADYYYDDKAINIIKFRKDRSLT